MKKKKYLLTWKLGDHIKYLYIKNKITLQKHLMKYEYQKYLRTNFITRYVFKRWLL